MDISKDQLFGELFGKTSSIDCLFKNEGNIKDLSLELIDDLSSFEHPFEKSLKSEKGIDELAKQIKVDGVLQPVLVRSKADGRYELLAGHRRKRASIIAGLTKIPAIIKECDDDTAKLIVTHSNLGQREGILPSEKGKAYKMEIEAIKKVAGRPKNNLDPLGPNFKSHLIIADKVGESATQVKRYIRLNDLIEPLIDLVDDKEIPLRAAVELSYLIDKEQELLAKTLIKNSDLKITIALAEELRETSKEMELSQLIIEAIINPPIEDKNKDFKEKKPKAVYKTAFQSVEKKLKKLPEDKAVKLAMCDKEELEKIITDAVNSYLETL